MHHTFNTLRLFIAATALFHALLAAPIANAQSVKGTGKWGYFEEGIVFTLTVDARIDRNGVATGYMYFEVPTGPVGDPPNTQPHPIPVDQLIVNGNQAIVFSGNYFFIINDNATGKNKQLDTIATWGNPDYFWTVEEGGFRVHSK